MQKIIRRAVAFPLVLGCAALLGAAPAAAAEADPAAPAVVEACSGVATALPGQDWQYGKANTSVAGHPGYWKGYDLTLQSNTFMQAEVKGFNDQGQVVWAPVPMMDPDSPHRQIRVVWGNALATPEIRIKPGFAASGGVVEFTC